MAHILTDSTLAHILTDIARSRGVYCYCYCTAKNPLKKIQRGCIPRFSPPTPHHQHRRVLTFPSHVFTLQPSNYRFFAATTPPRGGVAWRIDHVVGGSRRWLPAPELTKLTLAASPSLLVIAIT